jgi:hypothetical protein
LINNTVNVPARVAGAANGTMNFNLRVEQIGHGFHPAPGGPCKKSRWMDAQTYYNFANTLRNPAPEWLSSMVDMDNEDPNQLLWMDFKGLFKQEYAVQTNDRLILEGLSNLAMKPNEMTNEVISQITRTVKGFKESFYDFGGVIPYPQNYLNGSICNNTFRTFMRQHNTMMFNYFIMNLFKAALTSDLRAVVAKEDLETMMIKRMFRVATTAQREGKGKTTAPIDKIREDKFQPDLEEDENDVTAFNRRFSNQGGAQPKTGNQNFQGNRNYQNAGQGGQPNRGSGQRGGSGSGNNTDHNGKYCYYCNSKDINRKNARKGLEKTNHAWMPKDNYTGPQFT